MHVYRKSGSNLGYCKREDLSSDSVSLKVKGLIPKDTYRSRLAEAAGFIE